MDVELANLAKRYSCRVQVLPSVVLVYSQRHEWLIEIIDDNEFELRHFSNKKDNKTHAQIKFINSTIDNVFKYIHSHDLSLFMKKDYFITDIDLPKSKKCVKKYKLLHRK